MLTYLYQIRLFLTTEDKAGDGKIDPKKGTDAGTSVTGYHSLVKAVKKQNLSNAILIS